MPQNVGKQKQPDQKQEYDFRQVMIKSFQTEASASSENNFKKLLVQKVQLRRYDKPT